MENRMILTEIEKLINSNDGCDRLKGFEACAGRSDIPLEWLERGVKDCYGTVRCRVFQVCADRSDIPLEWLERGVNNWNWGVRYRAFEACIGRNDVPLEWLEKGLNDVDGNVRCGAFQACAGRSDISLVWLEKGVNDRVYNVRATASKILFDMGYQFPLVRMVEPADKVYKKCKNDVIVVAEIPKTAQVRGSIDGKCRASEAVIIKIIANEDYCVEAVSWWDEKITYKVGDHIIIDNFDHADAECSTGFHFFNTLEEAKNFKI